MQLILVILTLFRINVYEKLKQTKPGTHIKSMKFKLFNCDSNLCVINNLKVYPEKQSLLERIQDYYLLVIRCQIG